MKAWNTITLEWEEWKDVLKEEQDSDGYCTCNICQKQKQYEIQQLKVPEELFEI